MSLQMELKYYKPNPIFYSCFVMNDNCNTLSTLRPKRIFNPLTPTVAIWVQLRAERQSTRMSKNYK